MLRIFTLVYPRCRITSTFYSMIESCLSGVTKKLNLLCYYTYSDLQIEIFWMLTLYENGCWSNKVAYTSLINKLCFLQYTILLLLLMVLLQVKSWMIFAFLYYFVFSFLFFIISSFFSCSFWPVEVYKRFKYYHQLTYAREKAI